MNYILSEDDEIDIYRANVRGETLVSIAARYDVSTNTIARVIRKVRRDL